MPVSLDDRALDELIERSQDLQSEAMRTTHESLTEMVDVGHERRARGEVDPEQGRAAAGEANDVIKKALVAGGALAAAAFGPALLGLTATPAFASTATDIQMLQTSASIENLAVSTYKTALTLAYIGGSSANPTIKAFVQTTMAQHDQHNDAFNSAATALGGKAQHAADPHYVPTVNAAIKSIGGQAPSAGALAVVGLAITLEKVAAETYVANCSKLTDTNSRKVTASIMGVEAQHVATLLAVQALLKAGASQLITLSPTVVSKLPAAAGDIGFPASFYPIDMASPASEGAVA
jgi:rubrerythrin